MNNVTDLADGPTLLSGTIGFFQPHLPVHCCYSCTWKVHWSYTDSWSSVHYTVPCLSQEWLCHFRRPVLETGCLAVLHSWPSLAWCWVPSTFRTTSQIDGMWYDRILHSEVCITSTVLLLSHLSFCSCVSSGHIMVVTVTHQVKGRLYWWNACYHSVQSLLSSFSLSKPICIYWPVVLPVILCACETWCVTLRRRTRLKVFENKVLKKIFGPKWEEVTGDWRKLHN